MQIYNRQLQTYEPISQYGGGLLEILYHRKIGRILLKAVTHPVFSEVYGIWNRLPFSRRKIASFVEEYQIPLEDFEKREYKSFQDFFIRKPAPGKRPVDMAPDSFVAPADSKLSLYPISKTGRIEVKGVEYTPRELVGGRIALEGYEGGLCLVFRLTMDDCHRYCFVDQGRVVRRYSLKGCLHTVSDLSRGHKIYRENFRVVNVMQTRHFGRLVCIEVGALLVGRIVNHPIRAFEKGMEKGYFEPGGSTILYLLPRDSVMPDEDILRACARGAEVKLFMGEKIGSGLLGQKMPKERGGTEEC